MSFIILCLLCVVQGLTEFLPVSSSGHLTMFEKIFNIETDLLLLNLFLHLASLLAVVIYYRKTILKLIRNPSTNNIKIINFNFNNNCFCCCL